MRAKARVLVAEDEAQARESLRALLEEEGYDTAGAADGAEAARLLAAERWDAALIDIRMPGKGGLELLRELRTQERPPAILIMTAYGSSAVAIEAMKLGAFDYLVKPLHFAEVCIQLERAIENRRRLQELEMYRSDEPAPDLAELVGESPPMQRLYKSIGQVAATDSTVLIRGESGTGKELVARAVHAHSARSRQRLVVVNCASIPETLLEAELFGHERGAFTGATQRRIGKFEYADGGTLFLDEIGELSGSTQSKLLRVLQERTIERLGSNTAIPLNVRVLAATNRDLEAALQAGEFREDLYYRLKVVTLRVPPLRERSEDIRPLAVALLHRCASRLRVPVPHLADASVAALRARSWPGNVRELEHCLERALVISRGGALLPEHLAEEAVTPGKGLFDALPMEDGFHENVRRLERSLVQRALLQAGGNRSRAAELLRINRRLLYDKMREHGID